nr:copia protein [Tanacetum cinerariifolium]
MAVGWFLPLHHSSSSACLMQSIAIFLAVASLFFWQWHPSTLAVGTSFASGNFITGRTRVQTIKYADSDHTRDYADRKSTSSVCTFMGCFLTSWFSKKQTVLAISTTEVEYVFIGKACQKSLWIKQALVDYDIKLDDIPVLCDNIGAIDLSKNPVLHSRTKNIEIRHHILYENVQKGNIPIEKDSSEDNIVDIFTKPLKRKPFNLLRLGLSIIEPNAYEPPSTIPTFQTNISLTPLAINLELVELIFSIPPTSPHLFFDSLKDLPPRTTNPPPSQSSFDSIEHLATQPPLIPKTTKPPPPQPLFNFIKHLATLPPSVPKVMEPPLPPFPPQLLSHPQQLWSNDAFPLLTHEVFCEQFQRTQVIVTDLCDEMRFILYHILELL